MAPPDGSSQTIGWRHVGSAPFCAHWFIGLNAKLCVFWFQDLNFRTVLCIFSWRKSIYSVFVRLVAVLHLLGDERRPPVAASLCLHPTESRSEFFFMFVFFFLNEREKRRRRTLPTTSVQILQMHFLGGGQQLFNCDFSLHFLATSAAEKQACRAKERKQK